MTFLLIDYKGGGLAGAFEKNGVKLPHVVGTITNIDTNGLQRSLTSIQSELRRRQVIFNEARNLTDEGTIDIYKYQRMYHDGIVKEPVPHLLIICDEFAELKQQQPDFMDELISVSRIGRSLGVHLILATQKPGGIVDEQIRSNSKFAVCLKVQNESDSRDVLLNPDAAYLKTSGQFYLKVGNDEYYILGQSGWAGTAYIPADATKKITDNSVEFVSNTGEIIKRVSDTPQKIYQSEGEQLTNIVKYIHNEVESLNIKTNSLWLENIPDDIYVKELRNKYKVKAKENSIEAIIGEYDDPSNQKQGLVTLELMKNENVAVYGNAQSGKETLLSTLIYDLITTYTSEKVQLYILDFGTEALKIYKDAPHVGDVIFLNEEEKIGRFFEFLQKEIRNRKDILSEYNGDYNLYIAKSEKSMPIINIVVNNYESFSEIYENKYEDIFLTLTREGSKCGIIFTVTLSGINTMRYRLMQNFNKKIALQLNNEDDYYTIFDNIGKQRPSHIFGRGLIEIDDNDVIFEFQTAKICEHSEYNTKIENTISLLNEQGMIRANKIKTMPDTLNLREVQEELKDISSIPIGMVKENLNIYTYDFTRKFMTVIAARETILANEYISYIEEEVSSLENVKVNILDAEKILENPKTTLEEEYAKFINEIEENLEKKSKKFTLCIIKGIEKLLIEGIIEETTFDEILRKAQDSKKYAFIITGDQMRLKDYIYEEWYKNYIQQNNGIWVGNGVEDQNLININFSLERLPNNLGMTYGYIVQQGDPLLIKLIGIKGE